MTEIAIPVEGWSVDLEVHVESHLQEVCSKLSENFKGRLKVPPLALKAVRVFNRDNYEWLDEEEVEENAGEADNFYIRFQGSCDYGTVGTINSDPEIICYEENGLVTVEWKVVTLCH